MRGFRYVHSIYQEALFDSILFKHEYDSMAVVCALDSVRPFRPCSPLSLRSSSPAGWKRDTHRLCDRSRDSRGALIRKVGGADVSGTIPACLHSSSGCSLPERDREGREGEKSQMIIQRRIGFMFTIDAARSGHNNGARPWKWPYLRDWICKYWRGDFGNGGFYFFDVSIQTLKQNERWK